MSAINGDKSRYHRERKQKIARRKRKRELLHLGGAPGKVPASASEATSKAVNS